MGSVGGKHRVALAMASVDWVRCRNAELGEDGKIYIVVVEVATRCLQAALAAVQNVVGSQGKSGAAYRGRRLMGGAPWASGDSVWR